MKDTQSNHVLFIERMFDASPKQMWEAWTNPQTLLRWFGPRDWPAVEITQDLQVGGNWGAVLQSESGEQLQVGGSYLVLTPPEHLRFTFRWQSDNHEDGPGVETTVEAVFEASGEGTLMRFQQSGLVSGESAEGHTGGWNSTFDRLSDYLTEKAG